MPIAIRLGPVAPAIEAAAGVGQFAAGQQLAELGQRQQQIDQSGAAQAAATDLAQQRFADQQQQGDENLQYKYHALDVTSQDRQARLQQGLQIDQARADRQVTIQNMRDLAATGRLDQRGQQALERLQQAEDFDTQRDATKYQNQQQMQGTNWDNRWAMNDSNQANQDYRQQQGFDFRAQNPPNGGMGQDARQWSMADRQWREKAGFLQQQLRRLQIAYEGARRANYGQGDPQAMQQIGGQISALQGQLQGHMQQQPQIPQAPTGGNGYPQEPTYIDNEQNMTGQQPGMMPAGEQPQSAAPQHITDGQGVAWIFTGRLDPQTGEPLYQEA